MDERDDELHKVPWWKDFWGRKTIKALEEILDYRNKGIEVMKEEVCFAKDLIQRYKTKIQELQEEIQILKDENQSLQEMDGTHFEIITDMKQRLEEKERQIEKLQVEKEQLRRVHNPRN